MATSGRCPIPAYGSLTRSTSPSTNVSPNFLSTLSSTTMKMPIWKGAAPSPTTRPCPSHTAVAKSPTLTIAERPVRYTAIAISSLTAASSFLSTSTRIGSNLRSTSFSMIRSGSDQLRLLIEHRKHLVRACRWQEEDRALRAECLVAIEGALVCGRCEYRYRDGLRIAAILLSHAPQLRDLLREVAAAHGVRQPSVAVPHDALQRARAVAAKQYGRMRLLHRLWP